jgi:ABC-2 type transport system ATP-binding protein
LQVEARRLVKRFGRVAALDGLSFSIPAGSRLALIGPNGSGKSTLTRVLMGLLSFEGEALVDGKSPFRHRASIAARMAYVPQIAPRVTAPIDELLRAVARVRGLETRRIASAAGELELDLSALGRRPFHRLSGGMKQKLLIALALAARPSLLILDEPTGSLDARSRGRFFAAFERLAPDCTVILCSHRLEEVRHLVERVLALDEGRLRYDGPAAEYLAASTRSVIEVSVEGDAAARWLRERGFSPGARGWWARSVTHAEKLKLLPELVGELGAALHNVSVRDLETLEPERGAPVGERDVE